MNARGLGGSELKTPYVFSAADKKDINACINTCIDVLFPLSPLYAAGFSLGSVVLSNHVGDTGVACRLKGAIAVGMSYTVHHHHHHHLRVSIRSRSVV